MRYIFKLSFLIYTVFGSVMAHAALTLDRTRVIFNGDQKSISLNVANESKKLPFLAQSWLEDSHFQKVTSPLMVIPPLQRINMGERSMVRITQTAGVSELPTDRESVFYFNLREIPPKPDQANVMQIALQTKIKLFWRPTGIIPQKDIIWQDQLIFRKTAQGFSIENPTPYHVTLSSMKSRMTQEGGENIKGFKPIMIAPKSSDSITVPSSGLNSFIVSYINDYGGHPELKFVCDNTQTCRADEIKS